jgi:hypothetical protein
MWRGEVFVQVCLGFAILRLHKNISALNLALAVQSITQFMFLCYMISKGDFSRCKVYTYIYEGHPESNDHLAIKKSKIKI